MSRPLRSQTIVDYILSDIFTSEEKWTRGAMAQNKYNKTVTIHSEEATCWCLAGAIQKAALELKVTPHSLNEKNEIFYIVIEEEVQALLQPELGDFDSLTEFNDDIDTEFNNVIEILNYGSNVYYR